MQPDPKALLPQSVIEREPRRVVLHLEPGADLPAIIPHHEFLRFYRLTRHEVAHLDLQLVQAVDDRIQPSGQGAVLGCLWCHGRALLSRVFLAFAPTSVASTSILPRVRRLLGRGEGSAGRLTLQRALRPS